MEASGKPAKPAWMPSALNADAFRQGLDGLKELKLGDSQSGLGATVSEGVRELRDRLPAPGDSLEIAGTTVPTPPFEERPELYVGAAFAGGLALAGVLRLLGR